MRWPTGSIAITAAALFATPMHAQTGRGGDTTRAGMSTYTAEQATRGEQVFRRVCAECHETLEYNGPEFRSKWNGRPAFDLFDLMRSTMPEESPGSLPAQQYADVLAYMLKLNAAPPGTAPLPSADAELKKLKLDIPGTAGNSR
jgi:mono/diheme cytochrome c family protein